jgi:hypothetical protein
VPRKEDAMKVLSRAKALIRFLIQWQMVLARWQVSERVCLGLELKPADCWIGIFPAIKGDTLHVWLIILPCLPLHFEVIGSQSR